MDRTHKTDVIGWTRAARAVRAALLGALCTALPVGTTLAAPDQMNDAQMPVTRHQAQVLGHFGALDTDRDGRLAKPEWEQYRLHVRDSGGQPQPNSTPLLSLGELQQVDSNGDGFVNYSELYAAEHPDEPRRSINPSSMKELFEKASFSGLDQDGDNRVSLAEAAQGSMLDLDDRAAYDYYDADKDGDGNLSNDEFGDFQEAVRRRMSNERASAE